MRMPHYFGAIAVTAALGLIAAAFSGIALGGGELHLSIGLVGAMLTIGAHSLLMLFLIVTGRVLREAMRTRPMPAEFLEELNRFFAEKRAYPVAFLGAATAVAAGVLGYGARAFALAPAVHMLTGVAAVAVNLWAFGLEARALAANQRLIDRAAVTLDALDKSGVEPDLESGAEVMRVTPAQRWAILALTAWAPYLYWGLVVWRGRFGRIEPWLPTACAAVSVLALVLAWNVRGQPRRAP